MVIVFTDYATLKHLLKKSDSILRLIRRVLLPKEFDLEILDKVKPENTVDDYLLPLGPDATPI